MMMVVFRSRLREEAAAAYRKMAQNIAPLAQAMPGYVGHKAYTAEDGERVTIVEYESEQAIRDWARHPDHLKAKAAGRREFFDSYQIQICKVIQNRGRVRAVQPEPVAPPVKPAGRFSAIELMLSLRRRRWR